MLLQVLLLCIYYSKGIKIKVFYLFYKAYRGILLYQILGATVGYLIGQIIPNVYASFFVSGTVYVIIAFGGYLLFGKNKEEKELISRVIRKFQKNN